MRLDHIAFRVRNRNEAAQLLVDAWGYRIQKKFEIEFKSRLGSLQIGETFENIEGNDRYQGPFYVTDTFFTCDPLVQTVTFVGASGNEYQADGDKIVYQGKAQCISLEPPEKVEKSQWQIDDPYQVGRFIDGNTVHRVYHLAPEIFVSDGTEGSIVGEWVKRRDGIGGVHHFAYQCESEAEVRLKAKEWLDKGWAEFSGDVLTCPEDDLHQIFTKPHPVLGVVFEFIHRGAHGFCEKNVENLMRSTKDNK